MTSPKTQQTIITLHVLSLWCFVLIAGSVGSAGVIKGLGGLSAQVLQKLKAKFHQDFRTSDYDPEVLFPVGQGEIFRAKKGLAISFPAGEEKPRQNTGLTTCFSVRGDFEITVSYGLLKAERPKSGDGAGLVLFVGDRPKFHASSAVSLARCVMPDGKTLFIADRLQRINGKWTHKEKSIPSTASTGQLRLERQGATVRFRIREGVNKQFVTIAEVDFGKDDVHGVEVVGSTGGTANGLDLCLVDFSVRAEGLPGLVELEQRPLPGAGIKPLDAKPLARIAHRASGNTEEVLREVRVAVLCGCQVAPAVAATVAAITPATGFPAQRGRRGARHR